MKDEDKIKSEQQQGKDENIHLPDDKNPEFLFSTTDTELLVQIVNEDIDPNLLAHRELQKRGLNKEGRWVGFDLER